jgi:hypothetical protein
MRSNVKGQLIMPGQRLFLPKLLASLLLLLFLFVSGNLLAIEAATAPQDNTDSSSSVHATLSAMSDEQVRQLLIDELQKDAAAEDLSLSMELDQGTGAPLVWMLDTLNSEAGQSENQIRKLWTGIPNLLPDLYKVFISL